MMTSRNRRKKKEVKTERTGTERRVPFAGTEFEFSIVQIADAAEK